MRRFLLLLLVTASLALGMWRFLRVPTVHGVMDSSLSFNANAPWDSIFSLVKKGRLSDASGIDLATRNLVNAITGSGRAHWSVSSMSIIASKDVVSLASKPDGYSALYEIKYRNVNGAETTGGAICEWGKVAGELKLIYYCVFGLDGVSSLRAN